MDINKVGSCRDTRPTLMVDGRTKKKVPTKSPKHHALAIRPSEGQHPRRSQTGNTNSRENQIARPKLGPLNSQITNSELKQAMKELKSNSMGRDLIHKKMLTNLTEENKEHFTYSAACSNPTSSHQNGRRPPSSRYKKRKSWQTNRNHTGLYRLHPAWGK